MCLVFLAFFICLLTKSHIISSIFFFFNDTATTEIYTLSLHDALPIYGEVHLAAHHRPQLEQREPQVIFAVAGILLEDPGLQQGRRQAMHAALREPQTLGEIADADLVLVLV